MRFSFLRKALSTAGIIITALILSSCNLVAYPVPQRAFMLDNERQSKALTLMVYMAADNDLESYALQNLKQMERADFSKINLLVLLDRSEAYDETNGNWTDTRLFEVLQDKGSSANIISKRLDCPPLGLSKDSATELDMGNSYVLKGFIDFAKSNYPAQKHALIIWGHGTGWRYSSTESSTDSRAASRAVAIDDKTKSYMSVKDLGQALKDTCLDVIGFDTCFGSTIENLFELKDCTSFIVAGPGLSPAQGWNYKELLEKLSASDFSAQSISSLMDQYSNCDTAVTEASQISQIMNALDNFSQALAATINDKESQVLVLDKLLQVKNYSYIQYPCDIFIDINSMAQAFTNQNNSILTAAANNLQTLTSEEKISVHLIPAIGKGILSPCHSIDYIKDNSNKNQCSFIKESQWWVPTVTENSGSLLDKLFYTNY